VQRRGDAPSARSILGACQLHAHVRWLGSRPNFTKHGAHNQERWRPHEIQAGGARSTAEPISEQTSPQATRNLGRRLEGREPMPQESA